MTDLHTTDRCPIFRNFLIQLQTRVLSSLESKSLLWLDFLTPKGKEKQALSEDQDTEWSITEGKGGSGSESEHSFETGMTYKQVLQNPPGMTIGKSEDLEALDVWTLFESAPCKDGGVWSCQIGSSVTSPLPKVDSQTASSHTWGATKEDLGTAEVFPEPGTGIEQILTAGKSV